MPDNNTQRREMRFTEEELQFIKGVFKGNEKLLKLLRKVFLPEYDPLAPIGQTVDLWTAIPFKQMTPEQAYIHMLARQDLIQHVESQLLQIQILSNLPTETEDERKARLKKDSTQ